ncbi:MAG: DUF2892 domain-containing protein [Ignavibacteriales bacterium]|nr:DUF2892 domain-containing protein [Ignavibacteriales bacterium]MBI3787477.1 DUF2892 domain-containing protein [Ignavibacteriales bacterium]
MKQNIASYDKALRTLIAITVSILYLTNQITGAVAVGLGTLAVIFLLTSFIGFCPIYAAFRVSTKRREKKA